MADQTKPLKDLTVDEVTQWLEKLELGQLSPAFKRDAVDGDLLITLTNQELVSDLGCTNLQAKKILKAAGTSSTTTTSTSAPPPVASAKADDTFIPPPMAPPPAPAGYPPSAGGGGPPLPAGYPPAGYPPSSGAGGVPIFASPGASVDLKVNPNVKSLFNDSDVEKYKKLTDEIQNSSVEQLTAQMTAARHKANQVHAQLTAAAQEERKAEHGLEAAKEEKEKRSGYYIGKNIFGKKAATEKVQAADQAISQAANAKSHYEAEIARLQAELASSRQTAEELKEKVDRVDDLKREHQRLHDSLFETDGWRKDSTMNALSTQVASLQNKHSEVAGYASTYSRAQRLLEDAQKKTATSLQALKRTMGIGMMEMGQGLMRPRMRGGRGGTMMNVGQMATIRQANSALQGAARDIAQAQQTLPSLPWPGGPRSDLLKAAQIGLFQNVLFGGLASDMMQQAAIRKSMKQVEEMMQLIQGALRWVEVNGRGFGNDAAQLEGELQRRRGDMKTYQEMNLQAVLT